jgi:hypothetical protein
MVDQKRTVEGRPANARCTIIQSAVRQPGLVEAIHGVLRGRFEAQVDRARPNGAPAGQNLIALAP